MSRSLPVNVKRSLYVVVDCWLSSCSPYGAYMKYCTGKPLASVIQAALPRWSEWLYQRTQFAGATSLLFDAILVSKNNRVIDIFPPYIGNTLHGH